jgi:2'-hydroxyisoflavone reductase
MRVLVLGGTSFVGRHVAEEALARGHELTLFNRGRSDPGLFPDAEHLRGDRDGDLEALRGRCWDVAVDPSGFVPRVVRASAELLAPQVERYCFVSTVSVYADTSIVGIDEDAPVATLADETVEDVTGETYGALKALCERAVEDALPGRALVLRPGLIVGPHDRTDRFGWWVRRVAEGGEVLAPGCPDEVLQTIDVRDLAAFALDLLEQGASGTYNLVGPQEPYSWRTYLEACRDVAGSGAELVWSDDRFLLDAGLEPFDTLPLWLPPTSGEWAGFNRISNAKARAAGLRFRPLRETVADTLAFERQRADGADTYQGAGSRMPLQPLDRKRERELLAQWRQRTR